MSPRLPLHPNLDHLKKQAKDLLKSYRSGDLQACSSIQQYLPRFSQRSASEILAVGISLHEAQHVIARKYGFENWSALRKVVAEGVKTQGHPGQGEHHVLTPAEIASFAERGYVRIPQAFPREAALAMQDFMWSELKRLHGLERDDPSTWVLERWRPSEWTRLGLNKTKDHQVYQGIAAPRLMGVLEQLIGPPKAAVKKSWGAFVVTFPEADRDAWGIRAAGWHVWGGPRSDFVPKSPFLRVITFYSHVGPRGGAPLVVEGSHRLVMSFCSQLNSSDFSRSLSVLNNRFARCHPWLAELAGKTEDQGDRLHRFMEEKTLIGDVEVRVVELTGEPGDAILCHPAIFSNSSTNHTDSPSFIRG